MARRKIRNYESTNYLREYLNHYFETQSENVIEAMIKEFGFNDLNELREAEYNMRFGLDCGWVWLKTLNKKQEHEWILDNGKYDAFVTCIRYPYDTQSTTLKNFMLNKAIKDLGLENTYYAYIRLD